MGLYTKPQASKACGFFVVSTIHTSSNLYFLVQWINAGGHRNKKHKKQPFSYASASHLSLVLWHV